MSDHQENFIIQSSKQKEPTTKEELNNCIIGDKGILEVKVVKVADDSLWTLTCYVDSYTLMNAHKVQIGTIKAEDIIGFDPCETETE